MRNHPVIALVRYTTVVVLAWLATGSACADDQDMLQGTWKVVFAKIGKQQASPAQLKGLSVIVEGDKLTLVEGDHKETVYFTLAPNARTHEIDFFRGSAKKRKVWLGIYAFDGNQLKLCWGPAQQARPKRFRTNDRTDNRNFRLKKE